MSTPTNMTQEPKTADTIEASRVRDHAKQATAKRYIEGLTPSLAGTTLTILASPAWGVYVGGNLWRRLATEANHTETLTDNAVNHVYFAPNGNIEVNTSGTPADAGSVKLYTITVTAGTPALTSDDRTTIFDFPDGATFAGPVSAPGEKVSADNFEADGTDPELVFIEGAVKRKIRFTGTALQVLDESDIELTADLGNIGTTVESKTANFTAEASVLYLANHATPATRIIATLPQAPAAGDSITLVGGANTAGFRVKENATSLEAIKFLSSTTAGTGSDYWQCADPFRALRVVFDGTQWVVSFGVGAFTNTALAKEGAGSTVKVFTVNDTWNRPDPSTYPWTRAIAIGGGGGGGSGTGTSAGAGGGGGAYVVRDFRTQDLGATESITIGAGGAGGSGALHSVGGDGGASSFGSHLTAYGGGGGSSNGGGGGGSTSAGLSGALGSSGGGPRAGITNDDIFGPGGANGNAATPGGAAEFGGGGGAGISGTTAQAGGSSLYGAGGGGGGGDNQQTGAAGGANGSYTAGGGGAGGAGGTVDGSVGAVGTSRSGTGKCGDGGGGGGGGGSGTGANGGAGGTPGAGGGGGGGDDSSDSTAVGGAGARGEVIIISW